MNWWIFLCVIIFMTALALRAPLNHDEGQYVAAAHFVGHGMLPYRDFPYLQTPLQPIAFGPIARIASEWNLIALRLTNTICVAVAILLIGRTAAALAKDERAGVAAMLLATVTNAVLYAGTFARNDALPLMLLSGALERLYEPSVQLRAGRAFLVGFLSAAAASTKISYALPAASIAVQAIWQLRQPKCRRAMLALLAGSAFGIAPTVAFALIVPRPFLFQVYTYNMVAVHAWAVLRGHTLRLTFPIRAAEWTMRMMQGPLLVMLIWGAAFQLRARRPHALVNGPVKLSYVVAATSLATILPEPSLVQYLTPLAAPLIPWFTATVWPQRDLLRGSTRLLLIAFIGCSGLGERVVILLRPDGGEVPFLVEHQAHLIGHIARQSHATTIATLEPIRAIDSGIALDPRFATGQFLFRAGNVAACADHTLCPITFDSIATLREQPPTTILTGAERKPRRTMARGLDGFLDDWAAKNSYQPLRIGRDELLWLSPPSQRRRLDRRAK